MWNSRTSLKLSLIDESADYNAHLVWELKKLISKSLSELPYEQRRAFEMSRFEGKTYREIVGIIFTREVNGCRI